MGHRFSISSANLALITALVESRAPRAPRFARGFVQNTPLAVYTARRVADPHSRQPLPTHLDGVRHRLQSSVGSGSPAGALKHLRYCTLDQHSPKRGRGARQRQRGMAGQCKQSRKDGLERVSTAAELAHGKVSTHAPTQQAGRAQSCGRTPL